MPKNPNEMSVIELKALLFDLKNDTEICMQILNKKINEQKQQPEIVELNPPKEVKEVSE